MTAVLGYVRNRLSERSTWLGLGVAVVSMVLLWIFRQQIIAGLATAFAGLSMAATPTEHMLAIIRALLALFRPGAVPEPTPAAIPVAPSRSTAMSSTLVASLEAAALEAVKGAAAALPAPTGPAVSAVLAAFEDRSTANVLAAVVAVVNAVEVALATPVPAAPELAANAVSDDAAHVA